MKFEIEKGRFGFMITETKNQPIGIWGKKQLTYLKEHKTILFNQLVLRAEEIVNAELSYN